MTINYGRHYNCVDPAVTPTTPTATATGRLLIVDDDDATRETFARILMLEGYEVRIATNAESGLREIESGYPDAVILDLRMPFINGLGLLYRLRAVQPDRQTPIMVVTGDSCLDDSVIDELHQLGVGVRFKPLWIEDLVDVARSLLKGPRQPDELA
jgi:two-component system, OmpR family, response regulator MprA